MTWTARTLLAVAALVGLGAAMPATGQAPTEAAPVFGITLPAGYRDWTLIAVAHKEGKLNDLRAILGNDIAVKAARAGQLPYPDGSILARLAWSYDPLPERGGLRQGAVLRVGPAQERRAVHGQGLGEVRRDWRLGVRPVRRRQARRRSRAQWLLRLPRGRQGPRPRLQPRGPLSASCCSPRSGEQHQN